jgi:hypothetical protein
MAIDNNRMLLELEKLRREINREAINPLIPVLSLDDMRPLITMVANARARYTRELLDLAKAVGNAPPSAEQIQSLRQTRETYDELVKAAGALETVIEREYLDVRPTRK